MGRLIDPHSLRNYGCSQTKISEHNLRRWSRGHNTVKINRETSYIDLYGSGVNREGDIESYLSSYVSGGLTNQAPNTKQSHCRQESVSQGIRQYQFRQAAAKKIEIGDYLG